MSDETPTPPAPQPAPPVPAPAAGPDLWKQKLRESVRRDNPWKKGRLFVTLAFLVVMAGLLAWWLWPRPTVPRLDVIPFDCLTVTGEPSHLVAATEPVETGVAHWGGQDVYFEEMKSSFAGDAPPKNVKVRTDAKGFAKVTWEIATTSPFALVEVRYLDATATPPWNPRTPLRVFCWPASAPLLVIELDSKLSDNVEAWSSQVEALAQAHARGWKLVFMSTVADGPAKYKELHSWALAQMEPGGESKSLPVGPVLARMDSATSSIEEGRGQTLTKLKEQFQGPIVFASVTGPTLTLQVVRGPGRPVLRGDKGSWSQLVPLLEKVK